MYKKEKKMLYAMTLMVLLVFILGCTTLSVRIASVKKGDVSIRYYQLMEGDKVPDIVTKTSNNFSNQFEIPTLFYVVAVLYMHFNIESTFSLVVAGVFVLSRYLHSYIHLTYNNVLHRMLIFWLGVLCILMLWINLVIHTM